MSAAEATTSIAPPRQRVPAGLQTTHEAPASRRTPRARRGNEAVATLAPPLANSLSNIGVRKSLDLVFMRTDKLKKVSLIQRRAVNVLLSIAQRIDRSEGGSPDRMYSVDLVVLERMVGFNDDTNRKYMLELIRQIVGLNFEFMDGQTIHMGSVIAEIEVCFATRTLRYSLPIGMRQKLLHPERFNNLRLTLLNLFTSHSSLMLYELVSSYFTFAGKRTPSYPWQLLSTWLTGSTTPHANYREFSKLLGRAVDQVNEVCPTHTITLMFTKSGRVTETLWFSIQDRQQSALPLDHMPCLVSSRLLTATGRFGLKASDLEALLTHHDEDYLISQSELVQRRMDSAQPGAIASPRAYFLRSVNENWADVPREAAAKDGAEAPSAPKASSAPPRMPVSIEEARARWWSDKAALIRSRIAEASESEMAEILAQVGEPISRMTATIYESFKTHGLAKPMTLAAAVNVISRREFVEPTDSELSALAKAMSAP